MSAETPLTAEIAVRIAAAMADRIIEGLRGSMPMRGRHETVIAIGRAAGVALPEIDEENAMWARLKAEYLEEKRQSGQGSPRQSAEESA